MLRVLDVHKTFARRHGLRGRSGVVAVDDVSLEVGRRETVGVVGESGSGKSTLARLALRLIPVDRGQILFEGEDLTKLPEKRLRPLRLFMHLIHQDPYESLTPRLRVRDVVAEPMVIQGTATADERRARALEAIAGAGLHPSESIAERYPHELSGGQRQRVALARAFILTPRLIVADEPTSMLDASLRAALLATMRAYRDEHDVAILFITHDLALARSFCDRIAVMHRGRIVEEGPANAVVQAPAHPYTRALITAARDLRPPPAGYGDHGRVEEETDGGRAELVEVEPGHRVARPVADESQQATETRGEIR
jgi:ABC-type oligopeptide transport system ATPase subunit